MVQDVPKNRKTHLDSKHSGTTQSFLCRVGPHVDHRLRQLIQIKFVEKAGL